MRLTRTVQPSVFQALEVVHPIAAELERASGWLDQHPEVLDMIGAGVPGSSRGRHGLTCESILRCAVLMHLMGYSYRGLEFALLDSASVQRFARVDPFRVPKKSALQSAVGAIDADTWQAINGVLLQDAKQRGIESGTQVRIDSTVTETDILEPSDSRLLYDGVRVLTRLLCEARERLPQVSVHDHCRAAKRRMLQVEKQRDPQRRAATYRRLLNLVAQTMDYTAAARTEVCCVTEPWAESWCTEVGACRDLLTRVVDQTERRVFAGEKVPASEKVVSLFEPHTDIICKGGRQTHYGHKINLSTGRSALVLDVVVESGNPADSERCLPMLRRHVEAYGEAPQRVAFDGGYASRANLADAKKLGVEHVMFHKKRGMEASEMTPSAWIYGQLKRFRGGRGSRHFVSEALFWAGPLSVARLGTFPGVRALGSVRPQSDTAGSLTAILTPVGRRGSSTSDLLSRSFLTDRCVSIAADPERHVA